MNRFFEALAPAHIQSLPTYPPGKSLDELERELGIRGAIKLASNENPAGPSPRAVEAAREAIAGMHLYPDSGAFRLRHALSEHLGVAPDEIIFGAGSNELIHLVIQAMCQPGVDQVLTHRYAFVSYRLAALSQAVEFVESEATSELGCDVDALIAAMGPRTRVVFLANPNNPTGSHVTTRELERVFEALPEHAILVMDEAYHEYGVAAAQAGEADYPRSMSYRAEMPRLLTLRTFSKIYGLAGLRVGYGTGHPGLLAMLERVRQPFNVGSVAQVAAMAALDDHEHIQRSCEITHRGLAALRDAAARLGMRTYPSLGNFMLVEVGADAAQVHNALLHRGVIVRPMSAWGLPRHLRISACADADVARVVAALTEARGSAHP